MSRPEGQDRNQDATCYVGNLDDRATDSLVWELMLQAGPIINVHLPKDRITSAHQGYGFAEFATENDAEYACKIMNGIKLFGKPLRVNKASSDRKQIDIGANLFVGNLDSGVDERLLWETFSAFGPVVGLPKVARDPVTNASKSYGFVSYDSFEASDAAIEALSNQILLNRPITVQYALKKDGKGGERHGTAAERLLAQQARKNNAMPVRAPLPMGIFAQPQAGGPPEWSGAPPGAHPAWGAPPPGFDPSTVAIDPNVAMDPSAQYSGPPPPPPGMPVNGGFAPPGAMGMAPGPPPGMIAGPPPTYMTGSNNAPLGPRH